MRSAYNTLSQRRKELQAQKANCKDDLAQFALDPGFYKDEDISEIRERYRTVNAELDRVTREEASLLADHPWLQKDLEREFSMFSGNGNEQTEKGETSEVTDGAISWPEPIELPSQLLPVPSFAEVLLPEPLRPWLSDIAERLQCALDFPAVGALGALAGVVGRKVGIRPKRHDDWLVVPNLWGAIIGRPGIMKTPALTEVFKPLHRLQLQARERHEQDIRAWEATQLVTKLAREDTEKKIKAALKTGDRESACRLAQEAIAPEQSTQPFLPRYLVNDSTVEKLGVILNENPHGIVLFRDELTGWLRTLDRDGHENDRAFYLEAWDGRGSYIYDRIGRGTLFIASTCVSIFGGIQPGPLAAYLRSAVNGGSSGDDGLIQRFQLLVYPDEPSSWRNVDRWPNSEAKERAFKLFEKLDTIDLPAHGIPLLEGETIPSLHFTPRAQGVFDEWRGDLEQKLRSRENHPALEAHLSKYRSLMPSLALLFHLLDLLDGRAEGAVSESAARLAAGWCDFFEAHARRVYQALARHALFAARKLAERIQAKDLPNPFTSGTVLRKGWAGLATLDEARDAVLLLEELHWVRLEKGTPGEQGGRPRLRYRINPQLGQKGEAE